MHLIDKHWIKRVLISTSDNVPSRLAVEFAGDVDKLQAVLAGHRCAQNGTGLSDQAKQK
jgi:hypothetical protein